MAAVAAYAPYIAAGASVLGSVSQAKSQREYGAVSQAQAQQSALNERVAAEFEAKQADYLANQAIAVSHREAYEQRKNSALLASKALSIAAGSGASASDESVVRLISEIYAEGAYRSALAMYEGEESARSLKVQAAARRLTGQSKASALVAEGKSVAKASNTAAFSTLLSGASSLFGQAGLWE